MSNFLRALAERTVAPTREGRLQPRLASRFESGPLPTSGATARQGSDRAEPGVVQHSPLGEHELRGLPTESLSPASNSTAIDSHVHLNAVAIGSVAAVATNTPAPLTPETVNAFLGREINPSSSSSVFPFAKKRSDPARTSSTLLVEPTTPRTHSVAFPTSAATPASLSPLDVNAANAFPSHSASSTPASVAYGQDEARSLPANSSLPTAPTIRVHIGRVDIRAVHLPPAPATPRPPAPERRPLLPLEDYLKRQGSR